MRFTKPESSFGGCDCKTSEEHAHAASAEATAVVHERNESVEAV